MPTPNPTPLPDIPTESLGQYLKRHRTGLGLSQAELTRLTGIAKHTISKLENDYRPAYLSPSNWESLANALGCDLNYLLLLSGRIPDQYSQAIAANAGAVLAFLESLQ